MLLFLAYDQVESIKSNHHQSILATNQLPDNNMKEQSHRKNRVLANIQVNQINTSPVQFGEKNKNKKIQMVGISIEPNQAETTGRKG